LFAGRAWLRQRSHGALYPVAAIIDAGCISAGETMARDLVQYAQARLFGSTTAGASSAKRDWTFPSGIATLTLSVRSRWGLDGQLIEFKGIQPHVEVEAVPEDLLQGQNTEIVKAEQYLVSVSGREGKIELKARGE
jgi:C-terminal processing protease CtpA/Prc